MIYLLETIFFTNKPTWDDIQQFFQILFPTGEQDHIGWVAHKLVPEKDSRCSKNPADIDAAFPKIIPDLDSNSAEGKEALKSFQ